MPNNIKWGIIGLGRIAHTFASDLQRVENATLHGVASRDIEKAKEFSKEFQADHYFGSYEELAMFEEVDVVYIATPHTYHFENTMLCLNNGKSVLCEKPLGINSEQVQAMINEASKRNLFLMEGIWTRFIPAIEKLIKLLKDNAIGDIQSIKADFGFKAERNLENRLFNKKLGGGSLLDIGIYPIYLSLLTLGQPSDIKAMARMAETGVDSFCSMFFDYKNSAKANLESSLEADTPTEAWIYGTKGAIKLHRRFHHTEKLSLYINAELKEEFELPFSGNGYVHEIEEVNKCLLENEVESSKLPHATSLELITIIDEVKKLIGLRYDSELD